MVLLHQCGYQLQCERRYSDNIDIDRFEHLQCISNGDFINKLDAFATKTYDVKVWLSNLNGSNSDATRATIQL